MNYSGIKNIVRRPRKAPGKIKPPKIEHPPYFYTVIKSGMAAPAPPLGPQLGERSVNVAAFCKDFNERTKPYFPGVPIPIDLDVNPDRTYKLELRSPSEEWLLLRAAGVRRPSLDPANEVCGKISVKHLYEIAQIKRTDNWLKGYSMKELCERLLEVCRKIGIEVVKTLDADEYRAFLEERKLIVDAQLKAAEEAKAAKLARTALATEEGAAAAAAGTSTPPPAQKKK